MVKEYLVSYSFLSKKQEGFGHIVIKSEGNIKTNKGIKTLTDYIQKDTGGNIVILNIIELDVEEEHTQEKSPE